MIVHSQAATDVLLERDRQKTVEGWTLAHDDAHKSGTMAVAAACYALYADSYPNDGQPPFEWPWADEWWKPKDYRRDLVRAAALLIAEIERVDRASASAKEVER